ncbi:mediator of RNA polymerase II transcription subunit, putative [Glarea lozoyensis ATCC 20868]|uniref:Mediator of RNA polymerase II transcription subunit 10 n=2 Tax=Glarea lozoyensis TaxID=101852 RepID=S3DZS1_GLAL2|nr:mediator of RNA polymerase II transcription subunit, putative [Glarea lozoyensis ATCC 20868]EHK96788.1 putative Mediator of RNA polymerase II transcription subunit 10 [Glarea lozoyensis 74030]EPE31783.1 mediator of RNA polymerase II transcription subunit, putative [Glarea lozoyensis ATCC 20868]
MAPVPPSDHDVVEKQLKDIIQDLYQTMVQVHSYDPSSSKPSDEVLKYTVDLIEDHLCKLYDSVTPTSSGPGRKVTLPDVPPELIAYVDGGRNPDIYTREFVEVARRNNQLVKGKMEAFGSMRDTLAREMERGVGELRGDVERVLEGTGGRKS